MQKAWLEKTQERVQFTSSVIASMRGVKVMGLESRIQDTVAELRSSEDIAAAKWRLNILMGVGLSSISVEASKWLTFILFVIFSYIKHRDDGQVMNVKTLFTSLAILNIVLGRIEIVIQSIPSIVNAFGCLVRIEEFLKNEVKPHENLPVPRKVESLELTTEKMSLMHDHSRESDSGSMEMHRMSLSSHTSFGPIIRIERLSAGYSQTYIPILRDLSLSIFSGQMVMITGPVGSGKSTLLQTLLSETTIYKGSVRINCPNGVAYCAQTPWLVNKSIRDNIIGVSLFEPEWYKQVIQCCALLKDLESYAKGDQTLVGSKGIGLSGGQKQRIALARAVYSRKPILILDDIFSGLDAATEEHIFTKLMGPKGLFRRNGNTVVLATHAVHHLPFADNTLVLSTEGSIQSYETSELPRTNSGLAEIFKYANGKESFYPDEGDNSLNDIDFDSDRETLHEHKPHEEPQQLQKWNSGDETSQSGSELDAFKYYFKSIGWQHSLTFGGLAIAQSILWNALTIWLEHWSSDPDPSKTVFYMSVGKISYFNTTDVGIITNRFSQDLVHVDMDLPAALINFVESGLMVVGIIGISLVATPWIAIMLPPLSICFYFVARFYLRTSRQLRILEMEAKAPLYTHFQETLMGISTIRAFSWEREFQDENDKLLLTSQQPSYYLTTAQRWFAMILDMVVAVFAFSIVLLVVYLRHMINPGLIGLALLNTVSLSSSLKILIVFYTNLEISLGAIARMREFNQTVPQEDDGAAHSAPAPEWPSRGNVIYRNYAASHTINSDIVLKSINLDVAAGRKLGICGRSGSGKSSMITALFRLLETQGGSISIDGIDISKVSPRILRGRINILSQEPFFLAGTIRENLSYACVSDQHQLYTEELLRALEIVGLKDKVLALEDGLDSELDLDGFLSHGERQLFSLARAILRTSNIIVLDEFTSSVDLETDLKMQRILREHFWDKTILTVAHRLNTIVDYDTVILLDKGNIVEMGNPQELLQRPGSAFKALYDVHEDTSSGSV
ncbi:ABC multidrug transporter B [Drechslerella dactyloides]|uniref:ABC multidrug transporter B n=1 Tax=Drechslerella dactyloides TaxID=74499 RepID=A0AAD6J7K4_DREDA|nr:ABC multidrug transporter B [Drechslerella dactyloides]